MAGVVYTRHAGLSILHNPLNAGLFRKTIWTSESIRGFGLALSLLSAQKNGVTLIPRLLVDSMDFRE
jgi:hypothetical protein